MRSRVLNGRGVSVSLRHRGFRAGGGRGYFLYIVILLKGNYFLKLFVLIVVEYSRHFFFLILKEIFDKRILLD